MSFSVNKLDVAFFQRNITNTEYEQINISGSSALFYLDEDGLLQAKSISQILKDGGTTKASLQSLPRNYILGDTIYAVDTVAVGIPGRLSKYYSDPNNPLSFKLVNTETPTRDTKDGISIGKADWDTSVNATLDVSGNVVITGSLTVTGPIYGTVSSSSYALTASYVSNFTASSVSASYALSASYASNSELANQALSSSWSDISFTSITASVAINAVNADYSNFANISNTSTSASYALTASYFSGSIFFDKGIYDLTASNAVSASYALSASYASNSELANQALTASYFSGSIFFGNLVYNLTASNAVSASYALTASYVSGSAISSESSSYTLSASYSLESFHSVNSDTASYLSNSFDNFQSITTKNYAYGNLFVDVGTEYSDTFSILFAPQQSVYVNLTLHNLNETSSATFYGEYFLSKDGETRVRQPGFVLEENNLGSINVSSTIYEPGLTGSNSSLTIQLKSDSTPISNSVLTYEVRGTFLMVPTSSTPVYGESGAISMISGSGDSFEAYTVQSPIESTLNSNFGFVGPWRVTQSYASIQSVDTFDDYASGSTTTYHSFNNWYSKYMQLVGSGSGYVVYDVFTGSSGKYAYFPNEFITNRSFLWTKESKINLTSGSYLLNFVWGSKSPDAINTPYFNVDMYLSNESVPVFTGEFLTFNIINSSGSVSASNAYTGSARQPLWSTGSVTNPTIIFTATSSCYATLYISSYNNVPGVDGFLLDVLVRNSSSLSTVFHEDFESETLTPITTDTTSYGSGYGWSGSWVIN